MSSLFVTLFHFFLVGEIGFAPTQSEDTRFTVWPNSLALAFPLILGLICDSEVEHILSVHSEITVQIFITHIF